MQDLKLLQLLHQYRGGFDSGRTVYHPLTERCMNTLTEYYGSAYGGLLLYLQAKNEWLNVFSETPDNSDRIPKYKMIAACIGIYASLRICLAVASELSNITIAGGRLSAEACKSLMLLLDSNQEFVRGFIAKRDKLTAHPITQDRKELLDAPSSISDSEICFYIFSIDPDSNEAVEELKIKPYEDFKAIFQYLESLTPFIAMHLTNGENPYKEQLS